MVAGEELNGQTEQADRPRSLMRRALAWLRPCPAPVLLTFASVAVAGLTMVLTILPFALGLNEHELKRLGYPGVFVANFLGTASLLPVPGLSLGGQGLIIALARRLDPIGVALAGGAAMATAELVPYAVGLVYRKLMAERQLGPPGWIGNWLQGPARLIRVVMVRYAILTLFLLAAVPNPFFEVAGVTAGATRMRLLHFFPPVVAGKLIRAFLLVLIGARFLHL